MRLIETCNLHANNGIPTITTKVYWDTDVKEYLVKILVDGIELTDSVYFTDDKIDAIGTAKHLREHHHN